MGGIKLRIHPLFFLFAGYYALKGEVFVFLMVTVCAVVHELGHSFSAQKNGYRLDKITLMPFGAVVDGDVDGMKPLDEIKIALAGPMINLAVGILFVALWWIYPEAYAYTDVAVQVCFSLAIVNLIPAWPLDGGRVLYSILRIKLSNKSARLITLWVGVAFGIFLIFAFVITCFTYPNFSLLLFGLFVMVGAFTKQGSGKYVKLFSDFNLSGLSRGMLVKKQAVDSNMTLKKLFTILDVDAVNEIVVYKNGKAYANLSQNDIADIATANPVYAKIGEIIG